MIHIFNRSHYEDVLVTRVHGLIDDETAMQRMKAINNFEELLEKSSHTHILKFYLHISQEEQHERLQERIDNPKKHWKYDENDHKESNRWDQYMDVYADVFEHCNKVPWHIVPADQNWYKEYYIAQTLLNLMNGLEMKYPDLNKKE